MSKIIQCLKLMDKTTNQVELSKNLEINWIEMLELIGKINQIENKLVNTNTGDGFFLTRKLDWLDPVAITKNLKASGQEQYNIKILAEINSTNSYVLQNISNLPDKSVVTTEFQSQGRGRGDNKWLSKIATDLTVSFLYFFDTEFNFELLPLIAAIAINRLLKQFRLKNLIKWPNDIFLNDATKVAGILVESGVRDGKRFIVIGVGLNNPSQIGRNLLLSSLINHMDHVLGEYKAFGFAMFRQEWLDNCIHINKIVSLYQNGKMIDKGINVDLTLLGELVIQSKDKSNKYISSTVSLRFNEVK